MNQEETNEFLNYEIYYNCFYCGDSSKNYLKNAIENKVKKSIDQNFQDYVLFLICSECRVKEQTLAEMN